MSHFLFKDRDGQTPLPRELQKGLKIKSIQTIGELNEYEEDNITKGLSWLIRQKADPKKYGFWIKLHKKLFEQVWSWAGKIRTHELANPDFSDPQHIWPDLYKLEQDLAGWISYQSFQANEIAARFHERIETIHPFANGNGRFGRILTEQLCKSETWSPPQWGQSLSDDPKNRRQTYISAIVTARREKTYSALIQFMFS